MAKRGKLIRNIFPFLNWLPDVNRYTLKKDLIAGITGAVIVLPQGVAFAIIAGLPPIYGLYTAMVTPIIAALFGSSYHLVSGPTTAISIVVFSALNGLAEPGTLGFIELALVLTFMAGMIQFLLGISKLGSLVNFVSHSVIIGFTAGAAMLIAIKQLGSIFGIDVPRESASYETISYIWTHINQTDLNVFFIAAITLLIAIFFKLIWKRLPNLLIALISGSLITLIFNGSTTGIPIIGELPTGLPSFHLPKFNLDNLQLLAPNAFAIALLGLIEAVAIARSIGLKSNQQIDANQEFTGQGLSNIVGSFFSSYAGSGSFTRSGINYDAGAKTPLAAIFAALILMLTVVLIAPYTAYLPVPAISGIILLVAYKLIDFQHIKTILKSSRRETTVMIITFLSTLFLDLEFAIYLGVIFSLIFYLQYTSRPKVVSLAPDHTAVHSYLVNTERKRVKECPQLHIVRIDGSLFFGAVNHVSKKLKEIRESDRDHILIVASGINLVDVAGAEMLINESKKWSESGRNFYVCELKKNVRKMLIRGGYWREIGLKNIFETKHEAIEEIYRRLDKDICKTCKARVFMECKSTDFSQTELPLK